MLCVPRISFTLWFCGINYLPSSSSSALTTHLKSPVSVNFQKHLHSWPDMRSKQHIELPVVHFVSVIMSRRSLA